MSTKKIKKRMICLVGRIKKRNRITKNKIEFECTGTGELLGYQFGLYKHMKYRITIQQL